MENVASVDPIGAADAVSQIVATNAWFQPLTQVGYVVQESIEQHNPVCAEDKLDLLDTLRLGAEAVAQAKQAFIDNVLSSVHHKLAQYDADIASLNERAAEIENEVRQAALSLGGSIKGHRLQAVWVKGRESWDSKLLSGFAIAFPEIKQAQKIGEPSVSIRPVKGA